MPSQEVYDDTLARLEACGGEVMDHHVTAAMRAAWYSTAELGTEAADGELYRFLLHAFGRIDSDTRMPLAERDTVTAKILSMFALNSCYAESIVASAYDEHLSIGGEASE